MEVRWMLDVQARMLVSCVGVENLQIFTLFLCGSILWSNVNLVRGAILAIYSCGDRQRKCND
jgi:hypothetical protein